MFTTNVSRKASIYPCFVLLTSLCLVLLIMLSACASEPVSATNTNTTTPKTTPASGDSLYIPVSARPEIIVKSENAAQLTFVGSDTQQNISTGGFNLPYKKEGNRVTIDFGEAVVQPLEIKIPREASLTVMLANGNVFVDTIQGQVAMTLNSGTIHIKNFAPRDTNTIKTKNGTIDVTFAGKTSFNLKAQTNFGAVSSGYPTISQKRSGMRDEASGMIGNGSGAIVNLIAGYGSITLGPV